MLTGFSLLIDWRSKQLIKMLLKLVVFSACILQYHPLPLAKSVVFFTASVASNKNENPVLSLSQS
jgi:hypothetical protein